VDLTDALGLGEHEVVAFTGAGGKTTAVFRLCLEAAKRGRRAIATGSARFSEPAGMPALPVVVEEDEATLAGRVEAALAASTAVVAASGRFAEERFTPVSEATVGRLAALPGVGLVALEADGSRMRPFKAPAEHEPAVPPSATLVVAVVGSEVFGRRLDDEAVHRPERVAALTGAPSGAEITPELVARVLSHPEGGRKRVPSGAGFGVLITKVTPETAAPSLECGRLLLQAGVPLVVLANVREDPPVVEVLRPV
jgi:molybdenum cofactor cytidylyltransferase